MVIIKQKPNFKNILAVPKVTLSKTSTQKEVVLLLFPFLWIVDRSPSFNPLKKQKQNYDIGEIHSLAHLSVLSVQERLDVFNGLPSTSNSSRKGYEILNYGKESQCQEAMVLRLFMFIFSFKSPEGSSSFFQQNRLTFHPMQIFFFHILILKV